MNGLLINLPWISFVAQVDPSAAFRQQFNKQAWDPQTWTNLIIFAAAVLVFLLILHFILYYEKNQEHPRQERNPSKLFRDVMKQLPIDNVQRDFLRRIARDLKLEHPVRCLLSPNLFRNFAQDWIQMRKENPSQYKSLIRGITNNLFPDHSAPLPEESLPPA